MSATFVQTRPDFEQLRRVKGESRSRDRLQAHFELERTLSRRLLNSGRTERLALYGPLYAELFASLPDHPQRTGRRSVRPELIEAQLRLLLPHLTPASTYVEIGCGDAMLTKAVAPHVAEAIGVDVTADLVEAARPNSFRFLLSDGIALPIADASADLVYSNQVMEHLHPEDAGAQLAEISRILKPGGSYICLTPNRLSGPHDISAYFGYEPTGFHLREYDHRSLAGLFRAAGFTRISAIVRAKGRRALLPAWLAGAVETMLEAIPGAIRGKLLHSRPAMNLVGVAMIGRK